MADINRTIIVSSNAEQATRTLYEATDGQLTYSESEAIVNALSTNDLESVVSVIEQEPDLTTDQLLSLIHEVHPDFVPQPDPAVTSLAVEGPLQVISNDSATTSMRKLTLEGTALGTPIEVRSPGARPVAGEIPFFVQLLDSDLKVSGMAVDDVIVTGIRFTPNPETFASNTSKIIRRYQTMTRWVEEYWGDEMDTITFTGSSYSLFAYDRNSAAPGANVGLTLAHRENTRSYELMRALITFFTYNGCIFQDDNTYEGSGLAPVDTFLEDSSNQYFKGNHPRTGMIKERLYVNLFYDYGSYLGYFETFDLIEDSTNPFRYTYNIIFRSERTKYVQGSSTIFG